MNSTRREFLRNTGLGAIALRSAPGLSDATEPAASPAPDAQAGKEGREAAKRTAQVELRQIGIHDFGNHRQYGHALSVCTARLELLSTASR